MAAAMRLTVLLAAGIQAAAFVAPAVPRSAGAGPAQVVSRRAIPAAEAFGAGDTWTGRGAAALAGVAVCALLLRSSASRPGRNRRTTVVRKADSDWGIGFTDPETGKKNFVNPWDQTITDPETGEFMMGRYQHEYEGAVYKKVPVVEGLQFPLDPNLYYPPLEPPEPGAKWGDGRSPDGNWYLTDETTGDKEQYWQGMGRRKSAVAIVRIFKGTGQFKINGCDALEFMGNYPLWWLKAAEPICAVSEKNNFDIVCKAWGAGKSSKAGAIRQGLAYALEEYDFQMRPYMKKGKYMYTDVRYRERKKPRQPSARAKKPYNKR